jgi:hypothetical protein
MYCWIEPPNGYSICIHTSFGGYAEGFALVAKPKMREVLQLIAPVVVLDSDREGYWAGFAAGSLFQPAVTFSFALLSNSSRRSRTLI